MTSLFEKLNTISNTTSGNDCVDLKGPSEQQTLTRKIHLGF
jgi:hypothetical protein